MNGVHLRNEWSAHLQFMITISIITVVGPKGVIMVQFYTRLYSQTLINITKQEMNNAQEGLRYPCH